MFSLESNAAVRSRLTHSLEVADVGRRIAQKVATQLQRDSRILPEEAVALVSTVETACLMHDIGNPPFGHFGEAAIQAWAQSVCEKKNGQHEPGSTALEQFDGNPQGMRIVCRLQSEPLYRGHAATTGLNLTYTQVLAALKYLRVAGGKSFDAFGRKAGFFESERATIEGAWKEVGYDPDRPQRHPLVFIVEAADDIAYCMSDLEDGVENGLVSPNEVIKRLSRLARMKGLRADASLLGAKTAYARTMIARAATQYLRYHDAILAGRFEKGLLEADRNDKEALDDLKSFARRKLFCTDSIEVTELAGFAVVKGLLEALEPLLSLKATEFRMLLAATQGNQKWRGRRLDVQKRLVGRLPRKHITAYQVCVKEGRSESECRAHLIVDYVAGMTDGFALEMHRTLSGMQRHR